MKNFAFPYFSRDIAEFWRRWHISLSSWFRDYVYIPLSGSRVVTAKKVRNIFLEFNMGQFDKNSETWLFLPQKYYKYISTIGWQGNKKIISVSLAKFISMSREALKLSQVNNFKPVGVKHWGGYLFLDRNKLDESIEKGE